MTQKERLADVTGKRLFGCTFLLSVLLIGLCSGAAIASETTSEERVGTVGNTIVVTPGDSIQNAVDDASAGDTIEVRPGTYHESVTVDKELTLIAPDSATIDGVDDDAAPITIAASGVHVEGFKIIRSSSSGIRTSSQVNDVSITDVESSENSEYGFNLNAEIVDIKNVSASDNGDTALRIDSVLNGEVTVRDATLERSERDTSYGSDHYGYGLAVYGGKNVVIDDVKAVQNGANGIRIDGGDVRGQSVVIRNSSVIESKSYSGVYVAESSGTSEISVVNSESNENTAYGFNLNGDIVNVENVDATDNGDTALHIDSSTDGEVIVRDATLERSERDTSYGSDQYGYGLAVYRGESVVVDNIEAVQNGANGIYITGEDVRDQSVEIRNSSVIESKSYSGVYVAKSSGTSEISVVNSESNENTAYGFDLNGDIVNVENVIASENGDTALRIDSSADGEVTVRDVTLEHSVRDTSGWGSSDGGYGLRIGNGESVIIENIEALKNGGSGIYVDGEDVRDQSVEIRNSTVIESSSGSGVYVAGSSGTDEVTVTNSESNDSSEYGFWIGTQVVTITDTLAEENGEGPLFLSAIDEDEATIENSFPAPEYEVSEVVVPDAAPGSETTVEVTVANDGDAAGDTEVTMYHASGTETKAVSLEPGASETVSFDITAPEELGEYDVVVQTDDENAVEETLSVGAEAHFTVGIDDVGSVTEGDEIDVSYTIENTGGIEVTQDIIFEVDSETVDTTSVTLESGETTTGTFTYATEAGDAPDVDVEVASDDESSSATVTVEEGNETANDESAAEGDDGVPGFGFAITALAVLGAALLARRT